MKLHPLIIRARDLAMVGYKRAQDQNPNETRSQTLKRCEGYINRNMNDQIAMGIVRSGKYVDPDLRFTRFARKIK